MNNYITNFWRYLKFWFALKQGKNAQINQRFKTIENSGAKLSPLEKFDQEILTKFQEYLEHNLRKLTFKIPSVGANGIRPPHL